MQDHVNSRSLAKRAALLSTLLMVCISTYGLSHMAIAKIGPRKLEKLQVADLISPYILKNRLPTSVKFEENEKLDLDYTIDLGMQQYTDGLLKQYRPDFAAVVAMDAATGEILTMSSYTQDKQETNLNLVATFPAASIFKVVTSAAALDLDKVTARSTIPFSGRSHTLYRRDVMSEQQNRWTRFMSIKDGFALSVNCLFGKLGLFYVGADNLLKYANRYGFNGSIHADFPVPISQAVIPKDIDWSVVEAASGFNRLTTLSPVHGAMLAASIANDGVMMEPYLVKQAKLTGEVLYSGQPRPVMAMISARANDELRELMSATISSGTSRKSFRKLVRSQKYASARFGGKTGSLTGLNPAGKTEWFVGYVDYKGRKIALASVLVHKKLWRVRASQIASSYFEQYLYRTNKLESQIAKNP